MRVTKKLVPESSKMGIILLGALVALVGINGILLIREARRQVRAHILKEHSLIAKHQADTIGVELMGRLRLLESYANRPSIAEAAARQDWNAISSQLTDLLRTDDDFSGAAFADADGEIHVLESSEPAMAGRKSPYRDNVYRALSGEYSYVSDAFFIDDPGAQFGITFSARVEASSGLLLGVLQTTLPVTYESVIPFVPRDERTKIELFDQSGKALLGDEEAGKRTGLRHFGVAEGLEGGRGAGVYRDPGSGHEVIGGYSPVPGVRWVLISEEPQGRAFGAIKPLVYQLGSVGVAALLAAGGVAWLLLRLLRKLAAERNRSQTLLASIPDGVVVTDDSGHITLMNAALEKMTGWPLEEARDRLVHEVTGYSAGSPQRTSDFLEEAYPALRAGAVVSPTGRDHTIRSRDGRAIPISWTAAPLTEGERVTGIVAVLRDVSREREADQLKASLVSTASHELRTPLTMIQGFAELLSSRELPGPKRREAVAQIYSAAQRLSQLIDDLLAVSRIESGRLIMEVEEVDVSSTVEDALAVFSPAEKERLSVNVPRSLPLVHADSRAVVQVLQHLVSNALAYSPSDARVEVAAERVDSTIQIMVRDSGIGLSREEMSHIFDKFYRADNSDVRQTSGTGLGLYITRNLVEMQGGRIWVESEPEVGTRFFVALPSALQAEEPQAAASAS